MPCRDEPRAVEPTLEAEAEWVETIKKKALNNEAFLDACTPGYYNNEGQVNEGGSGFVGTLYGGGPVEFHNLFKQWRAEGKRV